MILNAADSYTVPVIIHANRGFDVTATGTYVGTITVQISKDGQTNWVDADVMDKEFKTGGGATDWHVRAGFKSGNYTSGAADVDVY